MRSSEFITEKWSQKYKRSINCNNPKGFSQRAHCQGRKKTNEDTDTRQLAWRIRFRRFKDLSPLMPERENKIYLMPTDHSALRTFGNLTGKDDEKITKMPTEAYLVSGDARVGDMSIINAIHRELQTTKDQDRIEKLKKLYLNTSVPYSQYRPGVFKYPEILADPSQLTKLDKSVTYNKNTGEIDIKDKIKEDEFDDVNKFINKALKKANYKFIGSGYDAQVWMKDEGTVVKILMPKEDNAAHDTFKTFYQISKKSNSPNLPQFKAVDGSEVFNFNVKGKSFVQYGMEQLHPLKKGSLDEWVVWMLADYSAKQMDWKKVLDLLKKEDPKYSKLLTQNTSKIKEYKILYNTLRMLHKIGQSKGYGWDPHTENVMQRNDGTLVITDPWA